MPSYCLHCSGKLTTLVGPTGQSHQKCAVHGVQPSYFTSPDVNLTNAAKEALLLGRTFERECDECHTKFVAYRPYHTRCRLHMKQIAAALSNSLA